MGIALIRERGFTLLELVVTLFLIALATAVVMPAIGRGTEGLRMRAEAAGFSAFLRRAREQSIVSHEPRAVTVVPDAHLLIDEAPNHLVRGRRSLSDQLAVEADPPTALTVYFSPEGVSSGGRFRLSSPGGIAYVVSVDPLSGRVRSIRESAR
jgi:prepilin-type N-terminal cleavage/methylation domain-containing protein